MGENLFKEYMAIMAAWLNGGILDVKRCLIIVEQMERQNGG